MENYEDNNDPNYRYLEKSFQDLKDQVERTHDLLLKISDKIVGWENFNILCNRVEKAEERVLKVEETCTSYETEREHFVEAATLFKAKSDILDKVVSREEFNAYVKADREHTEKIDALLIEINSKLKLLEFSWCSFKVLIKNKWFQSGLVILIFIVLSLLLNDINTTLGRLKDFGVI
jgi:hypothetical protein